MNYDYRFYLVENNVRVLVASYYSPSDPPAVGTVIDISMFKEKETDPNRVKVLSVEVPTDRRTGETRRPTRINVIVEPA